MVETVFEFLVIMAVRFSGFCKDDITRHMINFLTKALSVDSVYRQEIEWDVFTSYYLSKSA